MRFSVIMPIYNCVDTLPISIDSILKQTYTDWELLLIDDGSTDGSLAICEGYAAAESRVRAIHQENAGQGAARNIGIGLATGEYVMFCDADDYYEPDALEIFASAAEENRPDLIIGGFRDFCYSDGGNTVVRAETPAYDFECFTSAAARKEFFRLKRALLIDAPWAKAYSRRILSGCGIRFPDMRRHQDIFFNIEFYECIATLKAVHSVVYNYFLPDNDIQLKKLPQNMFDIIKTNYRKTCEVMSDWQQLDRSALAFLNQKYVKDISVLLRLNYRNQWELSQKKRRELSRRMLDDPMTVKACVTIPEGFMNKIIRLVVKSRSVTLANLFSAGTVLYQKIRG